MLFNPGKSYILQRLTRDETEARVALFGRGHLMEQRENPGPPQARLEDSLQTVLEQLPACELRLLRQRADADGCERREIVCGASGGLDRGFVLAREGGETRFLEETCRACPVPAALKAKQSCLHLVPVRRFPGQGNDAPPQIIQAFQEVKGVALHKDQLRTSFPCRWFYQVGTQAWSPDTFWCQNCPYWFPRPPVELIPRYWETSKEIMAVIDGQTPLGNRLSLPPPSPKRRVRRTVWQWLKDLILQPGK
jgi:hypothetical protein